MGGEIRYVVLTIVLSEESIGCQCRIAYAGGKHLQRGYGLAGDSSLIAHKLLYNGVERGILRPGKLNIYRYIIGA